MTPQTNTRAKNRTHIRTLGTGHVDAIHIAQAGQQGIQVGEAPPVVEEHVVLQREADPVPVAVDALAGQPDGDGQLDGGGGRRPGLAGRRGGGIGRAGEQDGHRGGGLGGAGGLGLCCCCSGSGVEGIVVAVGGCGSSSWLPAGTTAAATRLALALLGTGARYEAVHCVAWRTVNRYRDTQSKSGTFGGGGLRRTPASPRARNY